MSQYFVTGAVPLYVGGVGNAPLFLGWAESHPRIKYRRVYYGVRSDDGGQMLDADTSYQGQDAFIAATLTRINYGAVAAIEGRMGLTSVGPGVATVAIPGFDPVGSYGALMVQEAFAFPLWLPFPYAAKPAMRPTTGALPTGRRFLACVIENDDWETLGTKPQSFTFLFHAMRVPTLTPAGMAWTCYDGNMTGLPPLN